MYLNEKKRLLKVAKELYTQKLVAGTSGNVSLLLEDKNFIITPSSLPYEKMTIDDLVVMNLSGKVISGTQRPSSEWKMHQEIYMNSAEVGGVVHTHSPYATAFGICYEKIPVVLIEMVPFLGGDISVAPFVPAGSPGIGIAALPALKGRKACVLGNHGTLAIGKTIEDALTTSIYLEDAAKIYTFAKSVGTPHELTTEQIYQYCELTTGGLTHDKKQK